ncbi:MAG TPA: anhydro-N-acetylmuramic acid kinase [Terriglobales bacterium]|nr:anhydro-N-acetylmuramic acid kinase [Terriglobales bacterium]
MSLSSRHDALAPVRGYTARPEHLIVGLTSGTSADAVDAALVRFRGQGLETTHEVLAYRETPLEPALRREVLEVAAAAELAPERLMRLDAALGERFAAAVLELLVEAGVQRGQVDAIGSHGQTVRHIPRHRGDGQALTLQLGSASLLAEHSGIAVVSDFRTRDTAAGGEGAPLVSLADWWLFRSESESRVLLNLGGMANLTWLPRGGTLSDLLAFDTGPGNAVLDALMSLRSGGRETHDRDGAVAARGQANEALLAELLEDPFFSLPPPRSTGREHFGDSYAVKLRDLGLSLGLSEEDVLATAVGLTAASVAGALERFVLPRGRADMICVSGGGVRNRALMGALERHVGGVKLQPLTALGVPPESKEALAFAFLAHQTLCGLPGNVPAATGAGHPVVLGHITPGASV